MADIVERLRKVEAVERKLAHDCDMPPEGTANWEYAEACKDAATEIERLRRCLAKQPNTYMIAYEDGRHEELAYAAVKLQDEVERLRAALLAFADHFGPLEGNPFLHEDALRCFALARAALEEK